MTSIRFIGGSGQVVFLLVFARLSGLVWITPPLRDATVPAAARFGLAFLLTVLIAPTQPALLTPSEWPDLVPMVLCEFGVGALLGVGVAALIGACRFAGQLIGQQTGLAWGELFDVNWQGSIPALERFYGGVAITFFFLLDGHRMLVSSLLDSFDAIPLGEIGIPESAVNQITVMVGLSFNGALRVAAPAVVALVMAGVMLGLLDRAVPRLQSIAMALPVRIALGLLLVAATLAGLASVMNDQVTRFARW